MATTSSIIPNLTYETGDLGLISKSSEWKKEASKSRIISTSSKTKPKDRVHKTTSKLKKEEIPESKSKMSIHPKGQKELEQELVETLSIQSA